MRRNRRDFMTGVAASIGASALLQAQSGVYRRDGSKPTMQDVADICIEDTTGTPLAQTIDTFKAGDPSKEVTGIVTTFLATLEVLRKTHKIGANLVITHEPTYYNHLDTVDALKEDPVYRAKSRFIQETGIVIWRFHDYWHLHKPDGIINALVTRLGLQIIDPKDKRLYTVPELTFEELCQRCKDKLGISNLRVVGNPHMKCGRIGLFAGWGGAMGEPQITLLSKRGADVVICGETAEWTTCEYARDAVASGIDKGLIVLGHANSEEPGMQDVVKWLQTRLPGIEINHIPAKDPFRLV